MGRESERDEAGLYSLLRKVYSDFFFVQCSRKRGHGPDKAYCKQHDPEAVKGRRSAQERKYYDELNKKQSQWHGPKFLAVLRQIADGHNDPRSIAKEVIDAYEKSLR